MSRPLLKTQKEFLIHRPKFYSFLIRNAKNNSTKLLSRKYVKTFKVRGQFSVVIKLQIVPPTLVLLCLFQFSEMFVCTSC